VDTLIRAYDIGKAAGLKFVYPGNIAGQVGARENTDCPSCGESLIRRHGFYVKENRMTSGCCPRCGLAVPGRWEEKPPVRSTGNGVPLPIAI
jgi:pyruvate formate lyase activating enzyme